MAFSEYHSPQFSEDPAWLPTWLQPYEQTNTEFEGQNQGNATTFKACQFLQENLREAGNTQLTASGGAKYTTCNLYLSGDDYQQPGSASCSNAISLHLHLSSTSFSHVRSAQSNEIPVLCKHEMNKSPSQKSISKNPVIAHGLAYQYSRTDQAQRLDSSPEVFKQNVSSEHDTDQPIKSNHNEKNCHVNLDSGRLKYTVVDDLVEMSIAASEALVISEMAFTSTHSKSFSDAAILEIALRVKRARNESMLETPHEFSTGDTDDIDQIFELDENSMYGAFEDVGIAVPLKTSNHPFSCRKSSIGTQGSDTNQQEIVMPDSSYSGNILAVDYGDEGETITERIKGANTSKTSSKICSPLDCKLQSNNMGAAGLQVETNTLDNLPVDYTKQCLIDSSLVQAQKMHILDALPVNQMSSMEHHCLQKVEKNSEPSTVKVKKSMKLFKWETSFLSESMDALEQGVSQNKPSVELEIVASSNTALQVSPALCKEYKHEEPLSQDLSRSLSLADPLCSIVPCSISSEITAGYESKIAIDAVKMSKNPICSMYSRYLDEDSTVQENSMLQKPFLGSREFIFSETRFEQPSVPHRKQLNSLRPYSLPTDHHKMAEGSNSSCIQLPLHDINGASMHSSSEVIVKCSHKNDIELTGKCLFTGKSSNEHILNQNKIEVTTLSFRNMETYDTRSPVHEDACLSPIHGSMNQPCEGCKVSTCDDRDESTKMSPTSDFVKCRSDCSTKEASYRNKTINKCHVPLQSNLHALPADKRPMKKRVRFQEATCNMGMPKTSSLQSKCPSQCSCPWTTKQLQDYSLLYKPDTGRDLNVNYFTSNGAIWSDSMILQGLDFLLTGFSSCKAKDIEELIRKHGGYVLQSIPSVSLYLRGKSIRSASRKLPVVLCLKKVQTTKFLYGCAVNTLMLNYHWLEDSIQSGGILPPWKYMTRYVPYSKREKLVIGKPLYLNNDMPIFNKAGIMVHGKVKFCAKFMKIIKHGGGQVFKSLQRLVQSLKNGTNTLGIILVKNESCISRHLKHCALEHDIPTMSASWIISSLFSGKLLPPKRDRCAPFRRIKMPALPAQLVEMSQEI